ncbi:heme exporter protein CcmD [Marinobacter sp. JSM 1782161]|uniref:heme exporter protein CcmD n=1 Tax=Marinobacter sp. JSM 1782161 TaxID=2685906 RepID=UPI00140286A0|nr:heme exporter protein CcmD [Marinobacter sp. JSM 1782161]
MAFDSWQAFWSMGGHGPYVWTCYGVFLLALVVLVSASVGQRRRAIQRLLWQQRLARRQGPGKDLSPADRENGVNRGSEKSTA